MSLAKLLREEGIIVKGDIVLKSGEKSDYYCNFRKLLTNPDLMDTMANSIIEIIRNRNLEFDAICGVLTGAVPIASIVSNKLKCKQILVRDKVKDYGMKNLIDGDLEEGSTVLVIEDVITTGGSVLEVVNKLMNAKYKVETIVCLLDRGSKNRKSVPCEVISVVNRDQLFEC